MLRNSTLKGIQIPGITEKLITSLFADDTTVYLSQDDDFSNLTGILATWCKASKAKFNVAKTELIPIGSKDFRNELRITRKLQPTHPRIPSDIHIAQEGEATRIIGTFVGNGINEAEPWTPILEKIDENLSQWQTSHPTLKGKRLIIQMVIGGRTQFLTKAQGMPKHIETRLTGTIRRFIWDGNRSPPVSLELLQQPVENGGLKLLDLNARNEAIKITDLKSYLQLDNSRPRWAQVDDIILSVNTQKSGLKLNREMRVNSFLQTWNVSTHNNPDLPLQTKEMIKIARKYNARLDAKHPGYMSETHYG
ncbi:hypothetical protein ARMSODRAFT_984643 [Armillaria solidipes]|uniref:Reverse transcriptase domain-containing protein n=1 Tax=Armillaria solidipes TaxID=1076256 RepID=A0A2H3C6T1_9AGAR|nr:hypothetical protein ARMSODRAFT_984643 [Armillaria solidipes]